MLREDQPGDQAAPSPPLSPSSSSDDGLRAILASLADAVVIVDRDGVVRYANLAAGALLGRSGEDLVGQHFGFPLAGGERTELDVVRPGQPPVAAEMRVVAMEWLGQPAFCASLRDVTERKVAEAQRLLLVEEQAARRQAEEAVRTRDEFLSVAAHELKTPVTRLRLAVQLAQRKAHLRGVDLEEVSQRLDHLELETGKLARLVTQLLDVSRIDRGQLPVQVAPTDLVALTLGAVEAARRTTKTHTIVLAAPAQLEADVDPLRVEQVIANLLDNALRYSPTGGRVAVELLDDDPDLARLTVRDWGMGIPPEHRGGIFGRFYQAHPGTPIAGLGVGLYLSRQIVSQHGGVIEARFPADGGSEFVVTLPRRQSGQPDLSASAGSAGSTTESDTSR